MKKKYSEILLIDDKKENLELLNSFLINKDYKIRNALDGETALASIEVRIPDLILLDIEMPKMNGYEVCQRLKSNLKTATIPIIFISAHNDIEAKVQAFENGGVDYIAKPFANKEVVARVKTHLALSDYQHNLEEKIEDALHEINSLNEDLELTQKEMIVTLSSILETRDDDTGKHVIRVARYSKYLAELYGLDDKLVNLIHKASPFHNAFCSTPGCT